MRLPSVMVGECTPTPATSLRLTSMGSRRTMVGKLQIDDGMAVVSGEVVATLGMISQ
jgi:hypothetical protein